MKYCYDEFASISTRHIESKMKNLIQELTPNDLKWIADNREYGEKERYRCKKELDNTLKEDNTIWEERSKIEQIFKDNNLSLSVEKYCLLLDKRLHQLNDAYEKIFSIDINIYTLMSYWESVENISNIDNAHAMYLSSNNWSFSVFNDILTKLEELLNGDYSLLNFILSTGEKDIRTAFYDQCKFNYMNEQDFYTHIISTNKCIYSNGVCPCFTFIKKDIPKLNSSLDKDKFEEKLKLIIDNMNEQKDEFEDVYNLYCKLYYTRLAYDTYEYFGYYSFIRHYAIYKTYCLINKKDEKTALNFKHYASTYQFSKIKEILGGFCYGSYV